jgi:hypothetical protein
MGTTPGSRPGTVLGPVPIVAMVVVAAAQKQQCYCSECRRAETRSGAGNSAR